MELGKNKVRLKLGTLQLLLMDLQTNLFHHSYVAFGGCIETIYIIFKSHPNILSSHVVI